MTTPKRQAVGPYSPSTYTYHLFAISNAAAVCAKLETISQNCRDVGEVRGITPRYGKIQFSWFMNIV